MSKEERTETGLRKMEFSTGFVSYPEGSCLVKMGNTWVLCNASIEERVPPWLEGKKKGWVTAEYAMLPRATHSRTRRESSAGKVSGRSQEIQRLIGRALRACIDLKALGERTITLDCDVIQADGGTRCASINGAFVALAIAVQRLQTKGTLGTSPIHSGVAAVSVGMMNGETIVDLNYGQDSNCDVDMNFVLLEKNQIVEIQGTAEGNSFSAAESQDMLSKATVAVREILEMQRAALQK